MFKNLLMIKKISIFITFVFLFSSLSLAESYPPDFSELSARLSPAVVSISTIMSSEPNAPGAPKFPPGSPFEDFFNDFFEKRGDKRPPREKQPKQAMGSGFIIESSGLIVTNNHVIEDATSINVILTDGRTFTAELIGKDKKTDLALLKIETDEELPFVIWGDSDTAKVGNWVLAIGNPFGLVNTVTAGIISARGRDISAGPFDDFIQTDASINRGNSGGPLFNLDGEVIGINTAIFSPTGGSVGIGFSVPSSLAKSVIFQLKKYGKTRRGWLGVRIQTVTDDIAASLGLDKARGALISGVMPEGPAKMSGVKAGDIVLNFDGKDVEDMKSLPRIVAETEIDKPVTVEVWRNGRSMRLQVIVGEMEEDIKVSKKVSPQSNEVVTQEVLELGLLLSNITEDMRSKFGIPENVSGVLVVNVKAETDAAEKGILAGDIIIEISQNKVYTPSDVSMRVVEEINAERDFALILINRKGNLSYIAVKISKN
jgi:serine protease Do